MISLLESDAFKKEYAQLQNKIKNITNSAAQNQAATLLKKLVEQIKQLDSQHQDMFAGNQMPMGLNDVRSNITGIRKKLDKLCKDAVN